MQAEKEHSVTEIKTSIRGSRTDIDTPFRVKYRLLKISSKPFCKFQSSPKELAMIEGFKGSGELEEEP